VFGTPRRRAGLAEVRALQPHGRIAHLLQTGRQVGSRRQACAQLVQPARGCKLAHAQPGKREIRAHARDQLAGGERLDQIIAGPGAQSLFERLMSGRPRQQDHRHLEQVGIGPQARQQADPVQPWRSLSRACSSRPSMPGIRTFRNMQPTGTKYAASSSRSSGRRRRRRRHARHAQPTSRSSFP